MVELVALLRREVAPGRRPGAQGRVNELFRRVQGTRITTTAVSTVAMQADGARRVRGARAVLGREGVLVLGRLPTDRRVARSLGLPQLGRGEWLGVRVARAADGPAPGASFEADGRRWVVAGPDDPVEPAPDLRTVEAGD
ncbi:NaeI family type II restriction endonuclease [Streptomyces sp. NPDC048507]|uniref:NaeI family type II restriction endonuclease n=1 Tax=Streptomyces sp. NPDC048507 TaxID=3365560 RepID=UPI00371CC943